MDKNDKVVFVVIGIILFAILAYSVPFKFPFSIIRTTTCIDNVISNWEFNGDVLDEKGVNNGQNFGGTFSSGTVNLNGSTYISLPEISGDIIEIIKYPDTSSYFLARINGVNYVNGIADNSKLVIPLGNLMGNGTNISIDRISVFSNLSLQTMQSLYNNGTNGNICWTTSQEVNISCSDYAKSNINDNSSGSLQAIGDFYPNCSFIWKSPQYKLINNQCSKNFLYSGNCSSEGCYSLSECTALIQTPTTTAPVTTTTTTTEEPSLSDRLKTEVFSIGNYSITPIHLIIALIIILLLLYLFGAFGRK